VIAAWSLAVALLQADATSATESALLRLEQVWNDAHLRGDAPALEALWADDMVVTVPKMAVIPRETAVAMARSGRIRFERYETSGLHVRLRGDMAVVTGRMERARRMGEKLMEDHWLFTKVYVQEPGRWRVVAFHASEAPEP